MNEPGSAEHLGKAAEQARAAVESGENIRDAMRDITLAALSHGKLEAGEIKKVLRKVIAGASQGVTDAGDKSRQALGEALGGIDDALAKSAEASRLAVEEAAGRLRDYGKHDLQRAFNDMHALEGMFLETIREVAEDTAGAARELLTALGQHARNSGTAVGASVTAAVSGLEQRLGRTLREVAAAGSDAALGATSTLAEAASGFLAGIAAALEQQAKKMHRERK